MCKFHLSINIQEAGWCKVTCAYDFIQMFNLDIIKKWFIGETPLYFQSPFDCPDSKEVTGDWARLSLVYSLVHNW